jgi:hypothetical protein
LNDPSNPSASMRRRLQAAGIHLLFSVAVAAAAAGVVFGVWYPGMYRELAGGRELFTLIVAVDVVLGPLLTLVVFNLDKGWSHLRKDLLCIALIQISALAYGLATVYRARPVAMVFEVDRFRVITASDVHLPELPFAPVEYRRLPLTGPWLLGSREPSNGAETLDSVSVALEQGIDRGQRPVFWQSYSKSSAEALKRARPLSLLLSRYPHVTTEVRRSFDQAHTSEVGAKFLPLMARGGDWVLVLDATGRPMHHARVDGFF